ncbi:MAG: glycosyltransferase family 2 protein [Planctomycetes bacterium]|nr:glycosyltransferase family 2 protein [Planctomycetota bacterium]
MSRVAVLTVTHDSAAVIDAWCAGIEALKASDLVDVECVVVDQASDDGTPDRVRGATLVRNATNSGFAQGCVDAIAALRERSEHLLFLNPDVVIEPAALAALVAALAQDPRLAAVTPLVRGAEGSTRVPARPAYARADAWSFLTGSRRLRQRRLDTSAHTPSNTPVRDAYLEGSCMLVRRSAYEAVGGFDPRFFVYFEDADLCRRLADAGGSLALVPTAIATEAATKGSRATRESSPQAEDLARYLLFLEAETTYFAKWYGLDFARFAAWLRRVLGLRLQRSRLIERFGSASAIDTCAERLATSAARLRR